MLRTPAVLTALALASCASAPERPGLPGLVHQGNFPVEYRAQLRSVNPLDGLLDQGPFIQGDGDEEIVEVACTIVSLDREAAEELTGWAIDRPHAWSTTRKAAYEFTEAAQDARGAEVVSEQLLALYDGQTGYVTVLNQIAYIEGFDVEYGEHQTIADPSIGVATDGVVLTLRTELLPEMEKTALDVSLQIADLERPIHVVEAQLPGMLTPVSIQQPVCSSQTMNAAVEIGPEECLVLVAHHPKSPGSFLFAFLTADPLDPGE